MVRGPVETTCVVLVSSSLTILTKRGTACTVPYAMSRKLSLNPENAMWDFCSKAMRELKRMGP